MNYRTAPLLSAKEEAEEHRVAVFGPPPVNIFKELREEQGWSHDQLGRRALLSKQALIRVEQGTWANPLPTLVDYWVKHHGVNELTLLDNYEWFRNAQRRRHHKLFGFHINVAASSPIHPMRQIREPYNPSEVAKMLCVPQATIQYFERKWKQQKSVPKELCVALHDIGYTLNEVRCFEADYAAWRRYALSRREPHG